MTAVRVTVRSTATGRTDAWWLPPLVTAVVLSSFVAYATWAALVNADYYADPYLSPFYSPCLAANCEHTTWSVVGDWWTLSPALLILPIPLVFARRTTEPSSGRRQRAPYGTHAARTEGSPGSR